MRTMIRSGDSSEDKYAHRKEKRSLFNYTFPHNLALEHLERRGRAQAVTKTRNCDNEERQPKIGTLPTPQGPNRQTMASVIL
jgi:hypothetical protein